MRESWSCSIWSARRRLTSRIEMFTRPSSDVWSIHYLFERHCRSETDLRPWTAHSAHLVWCQRVSQLLRTVEAPRRPLSLSIDESSYLVGSEEHCSFTL